MIIIHHENNQLLDSFPSPPNPAGVLALVITLAAGSYQAIRAALANPVEALRSE